MVLNFNTDILGSDFVVNISVLKTHAQTVVSLRLPNKLPPSFTILDGIYTNGCGSGFDGRIRRTNILVASLDILSADMVGAKILGYDPTEVPHLVYATEDRGRTEPFPNRWRIVASKAFPTVSMTSLCVPPAGASI